MNTLKQNLLDIVALIVVFFTPVHAALLTVVALGLVDFITGIWAAKKRQETITSNKMFRSIVKVTIYNLLILISYLVEKYMIDYLPLTKIATSCIAVIEMKSLYENSSDILGIDLWSRVKEFMDKKPNINNNGN